jgi:hypothetical protein
VVILITDNDDFARGNYGDSSWMIEARARACAISKGGIAAARKRRDETEGRHEPDAVVAVLSHNDNAA